MSTGCYLRASAKHDCVPLYVPENFDHGFLPPDWRPYGDWLVSKLYLARHLDRRYTDGAYTPLYSPILANILPRRDYRKIVDALAQASVTECDGVYWHGNEGRRGRSKGYRLTSLYREAQFRRHWLHHPELAGKLARQQEQAKRGFLPVHRHLRRMLSEIEVVGNAPLISLPIVTLIHGDFFFVVCE